MEYVQNVSGLLVSSLYQFEIRLPKSSNLHRFGSGNKSRDSETFFDKQELENEDDVIVNNTDFTCDDSGDLILQRRHKRHRHCQRMLHLTLLGSLKPCEHRIQ